MPLIVEDGTGLEAAEAYVDSAFVAQFLGDRGIDWGTEVANQESALRRATAYLDGAFTWPGRRARGRSQALAWPRSGAVDIDGSLLPSGEIPREIRAASAHLAGMELASPGTLSPTLDTTTRIASEQVGPLRVSYDNPVGSKAGRATLYVVQDILAPLLGVSDLVAGSPLSGPSDRA
jgi:hypothetical protein